jgi:hypothetical protein
VAFLGNQAVTTSQQASGGPGTGAVPQLLVFPVTGTAPPATLPVTGITTAGTDTDFRVIGGISPTAIAVDYGTYAGQAGGDHQLMYRVSVTGQATEYGTATVAQSPIFGFVDGFAASQAGTEIAVGTYYAAGPSCEQHAAYVLDTATGVAAAPKTPAGGGPSGWQVVGLWVDQSGTPYVSLAPNLGCGGNAPRPADALPIVCKPAGGSWVKTGSGIVQAAYGPGNWLAEVTDLQSEIVGNPATMTISDGAKTPAVTVPNVTAFAWAP